jgi:putative ABC transport system substrate-binding protein
MSQGERRRFLIAAGALWAAPRFARSQSGRRSPVLGILSPGTYESARGFQSRLFERLHELGWTEGKTLQVERTHADYEMSRMPKLAADLVAKKVDVIWTGSPIGAVAAARATNTIPIVFWRVASPIEFGLIESLARPGRNVTGVAWADPETAGKRIQLLREIAPSARRLAAVNAPSGDWETVSGKKFDRIPIVARYQAALRQFGFEFLAVYVSNASDVATAEAQIAKWGADCMGVADVPQTIGARKQIIEMARRLRLPDYYVEQDWALAGGLFSYSIALPPTLRRTAEMIDQILRGAKPADMPVELPNIYEFVVNLRTAKSLGLNIPQAVLLRADRVIE